MFNAKKLGTEVDLLSGVYCTNNQNNWLIELDKHFQLH